MAQLEPQSHIMEMQTIGSLLGQHEGEVAWVFGKGPSLDTFDMNKAGPLRICINESILVTPKPQYFFAHDERPIESAASHWTRECRGILQRPRACFAVKCGIPPGGLYIYEKLQSDMGSLDWSPNTIAEKGALVGLSGTVHSALHFCRCIGVHAIVLVGMDGEGGYAKCIGKSPPLGGGQHDRIRRDTVRLLERLKIPYEFVVD